MNIKGKLGPRFADPSNSGFGMPAFNLIAAPISIQPVTSLAAPSPVPGLPIMREDFITGTGLLPPSTAVEFGPQPSVTITI